MKDQSILWFSKCLKCFYLKLNLKAEFLSRLLMHESRLKIKNLIQIIETCQKINKYFVPFHKKMRMNSQENYLHG